MFQGINQRIICNTSKRNCRSHVRPLADPSCLHSKSRVWPPQRRNLWVLESLALQPVLCSFKRRVTFPKRVRAMFEHLLLILDNSCLPGCVCHRPTPCGTPAEDWSVWRERRCNRHRTHQPRPHAPATPPRVGHAPTRWCQCASLLRALCPQGFLTAFFREFAVF